MQLKLILDRLPDTAKRSFLKLLLPRMPSLDEDCFEHILVVARSISVELASECLLERKRIDEAIALLESHERHERAAHLLVEQGHDEKAAENYRRAKQPEKAIVLYEKLSLSKMAEVVAEDKEDPAEAGNILWRGGTLEHPGVHAPLYLEAAAMYERAGWFMSAAGSYLRANDLEAALRCYRIAKYDPGIEDLLRRQNRTSELLDHWRSTDNVNALAEYHVAKEQFDVAATYFEQGCRYVEAAHCMVKNGSVIEGITMLIHRQFYEEALHAALDALKVDGEQGQLQNMVRSCCENLGAAYEDTAPEQAVSYYERAGNESKVRELCQRQTDSAIDRGDFGQAALFAKKTGLSDVQVLYESVCSALADSPAV